MARTAEQAIAVPVDPMVPLPWTVVRRRRVTHDTVTLELEPPSEEQLLDFRPGQFNMLYLFGVGESAISMSGDAAKAGTITHTIRAVGAVTRGLCECRKGDAVGVRGPFGTAWPVATAEGADVVVIAGGIGLAPLRPVIYHVLENRRRYGRVVVLYGSRSPEELLYLEELRRWRGRFDLEVDVTVDHATDEWFGRVGVVTTLIDRARFDRDNTIAMICGPEIMMRFCARELENEGVAPQDIYVSMERSMACGVGLCGHCQFGPEFVCKDGPVFAYDRIEPLMNIREV